MVVPYADRTEGIAEQGVARTAQAERVARRGVELVQQAAQLPKAAHKGAGAERDEEDRTSRFRKGNGSGRRDGQPAGSRGPRKPQRDKNARVIPHRERAERSDRPGGGEQRKSGGGNFNRNRRPANAGR